MSTPERDAMRAMAQLFGAPKTDLPERIEDWKERSVLVLAPHPDDDTFHCGGTLALLAAAGNRVNIVVLTDDEKGSHDAAMTRERLARIRRAEEQRACAALEIPAENIHWLGHPDGMLEYVDPRLLTKQITREIRRFKPDAVFSLDPGAVFQRWHKSDHNAAAFRGVDAVRAAEWHLYFPELLRDEGLEAHKVPVVFCYDSTETNYTVDISSVAEKKARACAEHASQFPPRIDRYEEPSEADIAALAEKLMGIIPTEDGRHVEKFRRADEY